MNYQINYEAFRGVFAVPSQLKSLLPSCSGTALKVLLWILAAPQEPISSASLSAALGYPPADVEEALDYWQKNGLLAAKQGFAPSQGEQLSFDAAPKLRRVSSRKALSNTELSQLAAGDRNIPLLIQEAERMVGRPLSSPEKETLCSFYVYDHLPVEYLLLVLMYCISHDKANFRYFERVVGSMLENDVDTYDKAEQYLERRDKQTQQQSLVQDAFGIFGRKLSTKEQSYIDTWFNDYHFDIALIKLAYERTVDNIGKASFPYTNRILSDWYAKGIKNTKEASLESLSAPKKGSQNAGGLASSLDLDDLKKLLEEV